MNKKQLPVYTIEQFQHFEEGKDFYANDLISHLRDHHFIHIPHKHDFFLVVIFTKGTGTHDIDFASYPIKAGSVFMLSPGQTHNWKLSKDIDGYVFFHSKDFFDSAYTQQQTRDFPFFASIHASPFIQLKRAKSEIVASHFKEILNEYQQDKFLKVQKIRTLIHLLYLEFSRLHSPAKETGENNRSYLQKLRKLEDLVNENYKTVKAASQYASMMNITEKHLNRICKSCLNKTTTDFITDKIVLEIKRLLVHTNYSVSQIADELGYFDNSYVTRLFKKKSAETPLAFSRKYR